ncbi:hypothetical protein EJ07DRAFT_154239 [Lizonia empirigonia]|nr:hypothetical protein EJ07DRAFT_154239 [Lizonia empirigonia]
MATASASTLAYDVPGSAPGTAVAPQVDTTTVFETSTQYVTSAITVTSSAANSAAAVSETGHVPPPEEPVVTKVSLNVTASQTSVPVMLWEGNTTSVVFFQNSTVVEIPTGHPANGTSTVVVTTTASSSKIAATTTKDKTSATASASASVSEVPANGAGKTTDNAVLRMGVVAALMALLRVVCEHTSLVKSQDTFSIIQKRHSGVGQAVHPSLLDTSFTVYQSIADSHALATNANDTNPHPTPIPHYHIRRATRHKHPSSSTSRHHHDSHPQHRSHQPSHLTSPSIHNPSTQQPMHDYQLALLLLCIGLTIRLAVAAHALRLTHVARGLASPAESTVAFVVRRVRETWEGWADRGWGGAGRWVGEGEGEGQV